MSTSSFTTITEIGYLLGPDDNTNSKLNIHCGHLCPPFGLSKTFTSDLQSTSDNANRRAQRFRQYNVTHWQSI